MTVTGEFPEEGPYYDVISPTDRDMLLRADPSTVRMVPWAADPTAQVIHDCYDRDGKLVPFAPRSVLRRVCGLYDAEGWEPVVAPELEFYLVARNTDPDLPLQPPIGRSGRAETSRQAYSIDAVNEFDPLFEDIYDYCEQMEPRRRHADPRDRRRPDGDQLPPRATRSGWPTRCSSSSARCARRRCATACTPPSWPSRWPASRAARCTCTRAWSSKRPARTSSATRTARRRKEFFWYIGGLQKYMPSAMAIFAPYVNSYRRLARNTAAPINIQWGNDNRTVGIRVPVAGARGAPHREPRHRRRRQSLPGAGRHAGLRLPRHQEQASSRAPSARAAPTLGEYQLPRRWARRWTCCAPSKDLARRARRGVRRRLRRGQGDRVQEFMTVIRPWEREHLLLHV